ncbi:Alpha/Beta hydrolase protein [Phyllosticta capitalensis]|uniref:Alpha/Beta hydrolase protein n=1 Tax=Phyllosticta capitalensis TaxID=121624 RepID=A0ABR1YJA5_9PEZI
METIELLQGRTDSNLTPLFLVHAVSGLALPYFALGPLDSSDLARPVYGITSPTYSDLRYQLPASLDKLAAEYVSRIRREIQSTGPYLLGGWSMGGMIAVKMAQIFEAMGQRVERVIMVDSANPETMSQLRESPELEKRANGLFEAIASRMTTGPSNLDYDGSSCACSVCSSCASSCYSQDGTEESLDDEIDLLDRDLIFCRMRQHIKNGLEIISEAGQKGFLRRKCSTGAVLIRCTTFKPPYRRALPTKHKGTMGWKSSDFDGGLQVIDFSGDHDGAFDRHHVGELTEILRRVLSAL